MAVSKGRAIGARVRRARHGGRRKRFDTIFERFWHLGQYKAALIAWGRSQEIPLDYSSVMRLAVQEFVKRKRISLPAPEEALTILSRGAE
jgi:hypothetical protein